ncbi:flap endonuclease GEN homolog 1 isoform X1 [Astyanax mexicanus]|uniref:flap endonuclease GEN homolog 1 isoform X1 n=2 Tax=Astyanax mexicanus TaxID=7994 RepID=UPI0020CB6746|nr:flap endonuclease GEN homolog 1 isoform X1 [Astyanax mexicanus]XP_022527237.2 flap endonuclease GEN homolog 1 isoform X1 [Astyanax mexicanus]
MGVNELWSILNPVRESVPLYSLTGRTLAVDLSLWICEAQHVQAMMGRVTKPHLRNLFFRVSSLLRMGVKLVFVMEGEAPKIKAETISKRIEGAFRRGKTESGPKQAKTTNTGRGRFKAVLRECAEMLDCLGVPWVAAAGEAEAMCAFLDAQGLVDGCITSDGDAFLYGAQTVYRNFNMNTKDPQIDCYKMSRVETELQLKRETLVGLAVLLGCDYIPKGVAGVGKEQTLKLIQNLNGQTLLQKFSEWKSNVIETVEVAAKKVSHCLVCRHPGSAKSHERNGCMYCGSKQFCQPHDYDFQCPCDWHRTEHARQSSSIEANIKKKTLACERFPFTEIISEFLVPKDKAVNSFKRRKPNLPLMQKFALDKMEWPKHYTSEKVLAMMTYTELMNRIHGSETSVQIKPIRIHKRRIRNGISCFEVLWTKPDHYVFPGDSPSEKPDDVRTVEEENLFSAAFPHIAQLFYREAAEAKDNKSKRKKTKAEKEKPSNSPGVVADLFALMSLQSSTKTEPSSSVETVSSSIMTPKFTSDQCSTTLDAPKPPSPCPSGTYSQAQISPSISVVLDELHLSSIDWDAFSFSASPSSQVQCCVAKTADLSIARKSEEEEPAVIKKNKEKCVGSVDAQQCSIKIMKKKPDLAHTFGPACKVQSKNQNHFLHSQGQQGPTIQQSKGKELGKASFSKETKLQEPKCHPPQQVRVKSTFVTAKQSITSLVSPQRHHVFLNCSRQSNDLGQPLQQSLCKRSVCINHVSSSEQTDSDIEKCSEKEQKKSKLKSKAKSKPQIAHKTVLAPHATKLNMISTLSKKEKLNHGQTNQSSDSDDDSGSFTDSPLPLSERLKLTFIK